jgi:hypothetical protein
MLNLIAKLGDCWWTWDQIKEGKFHFEMLTGISVHLFMKMVRFVSHQEQFLDEKAMQF